MNIGEVMLQLKNIWRVKMNKLGFIKLRKANKVVLIIIGIIIVFFILFRVVIYTETFIPGTDCKVVVSRFTHHYFGVVTTWKKIEV